jgi:predicted transposase YdaD
MSNKLVNPHDAFFKHYFSQPTVAADFLRQHLPAEVMALLDLNQLRLEKDSFVDEKLRSYFSDMIYTAMTHADTPVRIAFLTEHKSYPDEWVNFQVLRYQVGYWVQEFDALHAKPPDSSADDGEPVSSDGDQDPSLRPKRSTTLTPIFVMLVYHGVDKWQAPLQFAHHLTGMEDPDSPLAQVLGRYVPNFEPHLVNLSTIDDEAIRGEVATRLFVMVLKYIFADGLGGHLDEILGMASAVLRQPSGLEMVMALLRYISRSAVKLDKAEITEKLLTYLPKEGGVLMETLAQEWIEEGKEIGKREGIDIGKREGIDIGKRQGMAATQRQVVQAMVANGFAMATIAQLLNISEVEVQQLSEKPADTD